MGLSREDKISLDFTNIGQNKLFYDVIYNPTETKFLKKAKELGNLTENGRTMFLFQAAEAFKLAGYKLPVKTKIVERREAH